jgi:hypothetical protein
MIVAEFGLGIWVAKTREDRSLTVTARHRNLKANLELQSKANFQHTSEHTFALRY